MYLFRKSFGFIFYSLIITGLVTAQTDVKKDKNSVAEDSGVDIWLNTVWDEIDTLSVTEKSFNVEKVTTVAGVRGKEAESSILKHLYFRKHPNLSREDKLAQGIHRLETVLTNRPGDPLRPKWIYYLIQGYEQQGQQQPADSLIKLLESDYPKSKWTFINSNNQR